MAVPCLDEDLVSCKPDPVPLEMDGPWMLSRPSFSLPCFRFLNINLLSSCVTYWIHVPAHCITDIGAAGVAHCCKVKQVALSKLRFLIARPGARVQSQSNITLQYNSDIYIYKCTGVVEEPTDVHARLWPSSPPRNANSDRTSCTYCRPSKSGIRCIRS